MSAEQMFSTYSPAGDEVAISFRLPNCSKIEYSFSVTEQAKVHVTVPHTTMVTCVIGFLLLYKKGVSLSYLYM